MPDKWEYQIKRWEDTGDLTKKEWQWRQELDDRLKTEGDLGWELVHFHAQLLGSAQYVMTIWKRRRA